MAFSSIPIYLDPQSWRQQGTNHQLDDRTTDHLPVLNAENQRRVPENHAGGSGTAKPNSMVERARQEKIPLPESALRCPRCDSTNTKFCYFNNYSLSQPRHFCKTCRRYWTRGGALRNVPVGGGYRRNKRTSKPNSRSKSRVTIPPRHHQQQPPPPFIPPANNMSHQGFITNPNKLLSHGQISNLPSNLPILPPLQSLGDYSNSVLDAGLNFEGFQVGNSVSNLCHIDHWRSSLQQFQQFPFLINSTSSSNLLFPLMEDNNVQNAAAGAGDDDNNSGSVKIEEKINNNQDFPGNDDLYSRNFLGNINLNSGNDRFSWGGGEGGSSSSWTADHLQNGFGSDSNPATHIF